MTDIADEMGKQFADSYRLEGFEILIDRHVADVFARGFRAGILSESRKVPKPSCEHCWEYRLVKVEIQIDPAAWERVWTFSRHCRKCGAIQSRGIKDSVLRGFLDMAWNAK